MAHDRVTEVLRVGRDGGHRTIGNSVDGTDARNAPNMTILVSVQSTPPLTQDAASTQAGKSQDHQPATKIRRTDVRPILTRLEPSERLGLSDSSRRASSAFSNAVCCRPGVALPRLCVPVPDPREGTPTSPAASENESGRTLRRVG